MAQGNPQQKPNRKPKLRRLHLRSPRRKNLLNHPDQRAWPVRLQPTVAKKGRLKRKKRKPITRASILLHLFAGSRKNVASTCPGLPGRVPALTAALPSVTFLVTLS